MAAPANFTLLNIGPERAKHRPLKSALPARSDPAAEEIIDMNDIPESSADMPNRAIGRGWLRRTALAAALVASGAALPILVASAQGVGMGAGMHGMMHGAMGGGDMAMAMSHVTQMLDAVGASEDQEAKIGSILRTGLEPMGKMHGDMANTHKALHQILAAPTVDRAALEQLRAAEIARIDGASRAAAGAMADAAEVLRPDQRAKLATLMEEHGNGM
jgi:Spy/CpxP family protein refolding chaperone